MHEWHECIGHDNAVGRLVIFKHAAERALRRTERRVEKVHVRLLAQARRGEAGRLVGAKADLEAAALVVCAVGARHELAVLARALVAAGEPRLKVPLFRRGVV